MRAGRRGFLQISAGLKQPVGGLQQDLKDPAVRSELVRHGGQHSPLSSREGPGFDSGPFAVGSLNRLTGDLSGACPR